MLYFNEEDRTLRVAGVLPRPSLSVLHQSPWFWGDPRVAGVLPRPSLSVKRKGMLQQALQGVAGVLPRPSLSAAQHEGEVPTPVLCSRGTASAFVEREPRGHLCLIKTEGCM